MPLWLSRGTFLVNWDSVQYALGVESFDLAAHQPHPPGYIGYEWLGGLLAHLTGDVPAALTLLSVVSAALAPALLFLLGSRMLPRRYALAAAVLFGFSPLLWHYGRVALTYAPEVALSLPFVLLAHRAGREGRLRDLLGAALAFALLGSVRQSAILMLAPLWPLALRPFPRRAQVGASALLVAGCLAWGVPLMLASGGALAYVHEAAELADLAVARTAFVTASVGGVLQNVGLLAVGLIIGMHATLVLPARARSRPGGSLGALSEPDRRFLQAWVIVPVLFFVLIHTGQPGYALLILPAAYLWVGSSLAQIVRHPGRTSGRAVLAAGASRARGPARSGPAAAAPVPQRYARARSARLWRLVTAYAFAGAATVALLPELVYRIVSSDTAAHLQEHYGLRSPVDLTGRVDVPSQSPLATAVRQYSLSLNDAYWSRLIEFVGSYPEATSAVLTTIGGPIASGSFRHLGYYLPSHLVYAVGWDRAGSFGYLFTTQDRESDYSVQGMAEASETLSLPDGVRTLIVADNDVAGLLDRSSFAVERLNLGADVWVTVVHVPQGSVLELGNDGDLAHIRLRSELAEDGTVPRSGGQSP